MVEKSKIPEKSQKYSFSIIFFYFFFNLFYFFFAKKKCYPLSFPVLGGPDSTKALQSSPFQKYKNIKNLKKLL